VRLLQRLRIPDAVGAAIVLGGLLFLAGYGLYALSGPASTWLARAPHSLSQAEKKIRELRRPMEKMSATAEAIAEMTDLDGAEPQVEVQAGDVRSRVFASARAFLAETVTMVILLYFLLASGDLFLRKLVRVLPTLRDKKRAVEIARETENHISSYLLTVTLINTGLGIAVGVMVWLAGVPNAVLWGAMAGIFNFVPYLGAMTGIAILSLVSLLTFDTAWQAAVPPLLYLAIATVEGNFMTPFLLGRRFTLNPVMVFVGIAFWGFLWGVAGMLVAVPLLAIFKIFCDHVEPLMPVGEFLGE
jgi:predicted PurR-regulated permease PerM